MLKTSSDLTRPVFAPIFCTGPNVNGPLTSPASCRGDGTYLVLLQAGFTKLPRSLEVLVSSYLTFSPLPCGIRALLILPGDVVSSIRPRDKLVSLHLFHRAVSFLWHFPCPPCSGGDAYFTEGSPYYGPPCPVELGLSSPPFSRSAGEDEERPSLPLRTSSFLRSNCIAKIQVKTTSRNRAGRSERLRGAPYNKSAPTFRPGLEAHSGQIA